MQLIDLKLDHYNLFCPTTGQQILSEDDFNDEAPSFIGYWLDDFMTEPTIKNEKLKKDWDEFYTGFTNLNNREPDFEEIEKFMINYPEPNWVIFKITNHGIACGPFASTVYKVLNFNSINFSEK